MTDLLGAEREQQRFEHLVLGRPRPKPAATKRRKRRAPQALAPGIEAQVALRERWSHKQGTPETHEAIAQSRPGALARLYASGALSADDLAAAEQIEKVHRTLTADVRVRTASLETRIQGGGNRAGDGAEALGRVREQRAYGSWRAASPLQLAVLSIIVDDEPLTRVAVRLRMSVRRLRAVLKASLALWWQARRSA